MRVWEFPFPRPCLAVQNLNIAEGIDTETWQFHLRRGDYSNWLFNALKYPELADGIAVIENDPNLPDPETRKRVKEAILQKYTAPA